MPAVNGLSLAALRELAAQAFTFPIVVRNGDLVAFLLVLPEGLAYDSLNYRWFSARYRDFVYVDRIVVAPVRPGPGWGAFSASTSLRPRPVTPPRSPAR